MLWFPVGYTAGYLVLLALVAAPLRRSGAYTLPDFAESRLVSWEVRLVSSVLVVGIGWLYLLPQLQGAGLALRTVTGLSPAVGAVLVAVVVVVERARRRHALHHVRAGLPVLAEGDGDRPAGGLPARGMVVGRRARPVRPGPADGPHRRHDDAHPHGDGARPAPARFDVAGTVDGRAVSPGRSSLEKGATVVLGEGTTVHLPAGTVVPHADAGVGERR